VISVARRRPNNGEVQRVPNHPAMTLLALLVTNDERTHEEIIAGYEACARAHDEDATLSPRTFRRWLSGEVQTQPRPAQRRVARHYWGHSMHELLAPAPAAAATTSHEPPTADVVPRERNPFSTFDRQVTMAARRAAHFTALAEAGNLGPETFEQLRDDVSRLANAYISQPVVAIIGDLVETQDSIFTLLEGRQKPGQSRDLYLLAGVVSGLIAKTSHDLARYHEAMTQARSVFVCADNAGHDGLRSFARALQSLVAYWAGRPQEAVRYAQAGAELATNVTGTLRAWLPALEARAWAQLGDAGEATQAVERAQAARDRVAPDDLDAIGGLLTFPRAKQHYYAAGAFVHVEGGSGRAEDEATKALSLYDRESPEVRAFSDEAGSRAELALARVHRGQLEGAGEALSPVLDLPPERRIGGIVTSAARVHEALRSPQHAASPVARLLREEIETFCQLPVAALPR
jgi:tetratricopeptide (TPR) repeat protein